MAAFGAVSLLYFLSFFVCLCLCSGLSITTRLGEVVGLVGVSRGGRSYNSFTAIPYAKPPIGSLRLRNPQPHDGWEGVLDATKDAPSCTQLNLYDPGPKNITTGQEDCLYLNVYTPTTDGTKELPVLVYIHGGGFRCESPGPRGSEAYFMDEDVVLVSLQYRLGTLGFLSTEDSEIPGNFGLKDQALALKWIKDNIKDYGGDPSCIVPFGGSAGGASVHYLLTSPLSRDLLKGGISHSGVIDAVWAFSPPGQAKKKANRAIKMVGCESSSLLDCLQSVPAEKLIQTERDFVVWDFDPVTVFQPVVEVKNEGAFMIHDPRTIKVTLPWITGLTNGEGNMKTASLINQDDSVLDYFVENIDKVLSAILFVEPGTPGIEKLFASVKNRYFKDLSLRKHILKQHGRLFFELYFAYPLKKALERHVGPKYAYFLSHRAENSYTDLFGPNKLNSTKASHGDEAMSLFDLTSFFPNTEERLEDRKFSEHFIKLLVKFAESLASDNEHEFEILWKKYVNNKMLNLKTEEFVMEQISLDYTQEFWSKAYSLLNLQKARRIIEDL